MKTSERYWIQLDELVASSELVIDRPKGQAHPRYPSAIYPLDYGFLKNTSGGDGDGIDVWRGSLPNLELDAVVCTVDADKRDAEVKLLLGCSAAEKQTILKFLNQGSMAAVMIDRPLH